ncbi:recombinase family protein [Pseudoalteromonas sp. SWYJZ19]|uniref:recombinase family protein n=1 Tax=Pseudoalteromonas sp. SWYJZ19 TaxID=2792068 RepID=UPI0018CF2B9D|nr:recombinase family protein [Pseudoalteromonas sp. SWYJZ19]MBH0051934.1 recombinase family protein [Pseudoalteromonas sp. SWYJZ19]
MSIKAYSYQRFSSFRQQGGDSLRRQMALANEYASNHELDLQTLCLADKGVSAFRGDNVTSGALGEFIKLVNIGEIAKGSYLLVESLDRLSRESVMAALRKFLDIIDLGIVIVTLSDNSIYRASDMDMIKLIVSITIMSRAHEESAIKSMRSKAVWSNNKRLARDEGKVITNSNYPAWMKREGEGFSLIEAHVEVIKMIFNLSDSGLGYMKIAEYLNRQNIPTFQNNSTWVPNGLNNILTNKAVLGEYQPHIMIDNQRIVDGEAIKSYYPKVIDTALFLRVQKGIASRNQRGSGYRKGKFSNLFIGLIKCDCGSAMILGSQNKVNQSSYLKCPKSECKGSIRYQYAEPQMLIALSHIQSVIEKYREPDSNELAACTMELSAKEQLLEQVSADYEASPSRVIAKKLSAIESEINNLRDDCSKLEIQASIRQQQDIMLLNLESLHTPEERCAFNAKLRLLISHIEVVDCEGDYKAMVYYSTDGIAVLEQQFKVFYRGLTSEVYEMDGTKLLETTSNIPHILTSHHEESVIDKTNFASVMNNDDISSVKFEKLKAGGFIKTTSNYRSD